MQRPLPPMVTLALVLFVGSADLIAQSSPQSATPDIKLHSVGNVHRVVTNGALSHPPYDGAVCEYPRNAGMENMIAGYPVLEIASRNPLPDSLQYRYTQWWTSPGQPRDTIWVVRDFDSVDIPFWPSYTGLADEDFVYRCVSNAPTRVSIVSYGDVPVTFYLSPLNLSMLVSNVTWNMPPLDDVVLTRYRIIPEQFDLLDTYISIYFMGGIGSTKDYSWWRESDDRSTYLTDEHLAIVSDGGLGEEGQSSNCVGYRIFALNNPDSAELRWTTKDDFSRQAAIRTTRSADEYARVMHSLLSSGVQMSGNIPGANWIGVGPFAARVGDTLDIWTAEILGQGPDDVRNKSRLLDLLSRRQFVTPHPPPPPPLRVERGDKSLTLHWDPHPADINPETYKDPCRWDGMSVPFEGYRLYKSTQSLDGPWTMLYECDISGNGVAHDFGLTHEYTETGLLNHAEYYYAATSFSKPDTVTRLPSKESRMQRTMLKAVPGTLPRAHVGEVAVVPNPYRGDVAYNQYDPPWERPTGNLKMWTESDRRVQFIHLPTSCVISIYTLAGDLVEFIRHSDANMSFHDWNLTSYVGQAVASGLYLFSVEDSQTGEVQVGKFVVIR